MKEEFMKQVLLLAEKGLGKTSPNPLVGAVLVKDGKIIGEGFHTAYGKDHAEVRAIKDAKTHGCDLSQSSLYVNLEPCVHFGNTPPCVEAIVSSGVCEVYIGMEDPDRRVQGRGIHALREKNIHVEVGVLEVESQKLNRFYIKHRTTGLPYVILKIAATLDGKIADSHGTSQWITGDGARCYVHRLRSQVDAILVGINTVLKDDPRLTVRLPKVQASPWRIVLDSHLKIPLSAKILNDSFVSKTMVVTLENNKEKLDAIRQKGAKALRVQEQDGKVALKPVLQGLASDGIISLIVEGGASTNTSFLKEQLVDQLDYFFAPRILGGDGLSSIAPLGVSDLEHALSFKDFRFEKVGNDFLFEGFL